MFSYHPPAGEVLPCACASLRRAARAVTRLYELHFKYTGLTLPQFTLLQVLDLGGPTPQGQLGDALATDSTTLSRTLAPLRKRKLIEPGAGVDGRELRWTLTAAGRQRLASATAAWKRAQSALRGQLPKANWDRLLPDMTTLAAASYQSYKRRASTR